MNAGQIQSEWTPNAEVLGVTTITWGTEGQGINFGSTTYSSYIVISYREADRIEEIPIEQGSGFEAIVFLLNKGKDVTVTVVDDTSVTAPTLANNPITISSAFSPGFNAALIGKSGDTARKREGQREFTLRSFNAINNFH